MVKIGDLSVDLMAKTSLLGEPKVRNWNYWLFLLDSLIAFIWYKRFPSIGWYRWPKRWFNGKDFTVRWTKSEKVELLTISYRFFDYSRVVKEFPITGAACWLKFWTIAKRLTIPQTIYEVNKTKMRKLICHTWCFDYLLGGKRVLQVLVLEHQRQLM